MKNILIVSVFTIFAFAVTSGNANLIRKPGEFDMTAKFQTKLTDILKTVPDPIVLSDKNIQLNTSNVELGVTLSGSISGIKALTLEDLKISILGGISISHFEFHLEKLIVNISSYDLNGILGLTHIFGKGEIFINLEQIVLQGSAKLHIFMVDKIQYAQITSLTANLSLDYDKFNFKITGWLDDEIRSEYMSNLITNLVNNMPPELQVFLDNQLSSILTKLVADKPFELKLN